MRWLKINFGEVFSAWMHVKVLRVFVESVLRLILTLFHHLIKLLKSNLTRFGIDDSDSRRGIYKSKAIVLLINFN